MTINTDFQDKLDNLTIDEFKKLYKLKDKDFDTWVKEYNLVPKYKYRTPITYQLIPIDSIVSKELDKKTTASDYVDVDVNLPWKSKEIEMREKIKDELSVNIGNLLFKIEKDTNDLNKLYKELAYQQFMLKVIQFVTPGDIIGVMSEEQYGKYDVPTSINENLLTVEMILSYVTSKYGLAKALELKSILENENRFDFVK